MLGKLALGMKITDAERRIIDYSVAEGLKFLKPQTDQRNQAKLVVTLYAWAVYLTYSSDVRRAKDEWRQTVIIQTGNAAINRHTREQHNGYVQWLMRNAAPGDGFLAHRLVRQAFPFLFYRILAHIWLLPTLEDNLHPNTLRKVFDEWVKHPDYLNECVDFDGLQSQLDALCVACSVTAAYTYGLTTGRYIHRSVVPQSVEDLPVFCDTFVSYSAEDRVAAESLVTALAAGGRAPWFDKNTTPQGRFDRQINNYLDDAQCVIVLWSRWSINSQWVRGEALRAFDQQKLYNVILDGVSPPVPFNTVHAHALDRSEDGISPDLLEPLVAGICRRFAGFSADDG